MTIWNIVSGPFVGGLIGFCTNYIAVKMLFRPLYPVKIGKWILPFTPGLIPKRKSELAKVVGTAIGNELLTPNDIQQVLLSENMKQTVVSTILHQMQKVLDNPSSIKDGLIRISSVDSYERRREKLIQSLSSKIVEGCLRNNLGGIIAEESIRAVKEKVQGKMLSVFMNDKLIDSTGKLIEEKVNSYLEKEGEEKISSIITQEITTTEEQPISEIIASHMPSQDKLSGMIELVYRSSIEKGAEKVIGEFHIAEIVQSKIDAMDVAELEKLVLLVMKKELNTIVNLGALLGFLIGIIHVFL